MDICVRVSQHTFGGLRVRSMAIAETTLRGVATEQSGGGWRWYLRHASGVRAGEGEATTWAEVVAAIGRSLEPEPHADLLPTAARTPLPRPARRRIHDA